MLCHSKKNRKNEEQGGRCIMEDFLKEFHMRGEKEPLIFLQIMYV